ncbi:MAG: Tn3 family transposase [Actinomycetota bacterium]|nr:Tn3 family transposase [Actinomycetota bacterium]
MECEATGELPFARVRNEVGLERLRAAATLKAGQLPPLEEQQLDQLHGSYSHLRRGMHAVLDVVTLCGATSTDDELLAALHRIRQARGRFVDEPVDLLPKAWRSWVLDADGRVQRTSFELGLWFAARDALRAGRLFRPIGRRYADPAGFLMPTARWQADRLELAVTFGRPLDADERLRELERDQQAALHRLQAAVDAGDGVRLVGDPDAAHRHHRPARRGRTLDRVPGAAHARRRRDPAHPRSAAASPRRAARQRPEPRADPDGGVLSAELPPARVGDRMVSRRRALQAANDVLVDYLHQLQLAAHWGTGAFSSSDGQRSAARGRAASTGAITREFGFRRGALNLLNWVSYQYSQYGTKVVSVAEREAIHTLEAILHTQLPITEHTTDTHGATELVFALLVSAHRQGCPSTPSYGTEHARTGSAARTTTSCGPRRPQARLGPREPPDHPAEERHAPEPARRRAWRVRADRASQLPPVYCADPALRARIHGQLNKGETLHALRRHLVIGSRAQIPADEDDHRRHALCLQILVNAAQIWNARYKTASIDHLHIARPEIVADDQALSRVAPVTHAHVNSLGRYDLDRQPPPPGELRPLRLVDEDDRATPTPPLGMSGDKH